MNPLAGLYGGVAGLRNALFDRGVLSARRLKQSGEFVGGGIGEDSVRHRTGRVVEGAGHSV